MILLIIFLLLALGFGCFGYKTFDDYDHIILNLLSVTATIVFGIIVVVLFCVLINKITTEPAILTEYEIQYESIMHQLDMYDEKDYSKRDLYSSIERWNRDLARVNKLRENFFIRDFYYDVSGLQFIPFPDS